MQGRREANARVEVTEPAPRATPNVVVAMHLEEALDPSRTVVWTVAFQAAWDALTDTVRTEWKLPGLDLGPPARPEDVRVLAAGRLRPGIVAPNDLTVVAGAATDKTWGAIDRESDRPRPTGAPAPNPRDLVAFARVKASVRYETRFQTNTAPIHFGPARTPVCGCGFDGFSSGERADRLRRLVRLHLDGTRFEENVTRRSVIELTGGDGARVVVSGRPPKATLRATWDDVATAVRSLAPTRIEITDSIAIPRVAIATERSFDALVGAEIVGIPRSRLAVAREDVRLTADENGADVDAAASVVVSMGGPMRIEFDGPFLLAMLAKGSDAPFVLAWIGSADALSPWNTPVGRPLTKDEAAEFVGTWKVDLPASNEATLARGRALDQGHRKLSSEEWTRDRDGVRESLGATSFDVVVAPDGVATVETGRRGATPRRDVVPITADGARRWLALPKVATKAPEDDAEAATEIAYAVTRDHDRLVLTPTSSGDPVRILVRR